MSSNLGEVEELDIWLEGDDHRHSCIGVSESQPCCLDKVDIHGNPMPGRVFIEALIREMITEAQSEARLIELDLLEQAINTGWDMNEYKMHRLKELNL